MLQGFPESFLMASFGEYLPLEVQGFVMGVGGWLVQAWEAFVQ